MKEYEVRWPGGYTLLVKAADPAAAEVKAKARKKQLDTELTVTEVKHEKVVH